MKQRNSTSDEQLSNVIASNVPPDGLHAPQTVAELANLRYVDDTTPGIQRRRCGRGFTYMDPQGRRVTDEAVRGRIASLVIPPAWEDVWICPHPDGHLQATGRDEKGRKQYRYHPRWVEVSTRTKFARLGPFGDLLPRLRRQVQRDLRKRTLTRRKVVAAVIEILDRTLIRVGNREYAEANDSFGLTTMQDRHVDFGPSAVHFRFQGKSGQFHEVELRDRRLARIVCACEEIPGQHLFQYQGDDGAYHPVLSTDVNDYLHEVLGDSFTAKDIRTWRASAIACGALAEWLDFETKKEAEQVVRSTLCTVSEALGNTVAVCRTSYVHPGLFDLYRERRLAQALDGFRYRGRSLLDRDEQTLRHVLKAF